MNKDCIEIVAIRHGETEANKLGIIQGQTNTQLDAVGKAQAAAAAWRLRHEKFDLMLASDLDRAMDTAQAILQYHPGLPLQKEPLLREWNLGILQGKCADNMTAEEKKLFEALFCSQIVLPIPGGESLEEFQSRISGLLEKLRGEHAGKRLLLVTHGGAMQRMFSHTVGALTAGNLRPACNNTSISVFRCQSGKWQLVCWNH